MKNIEAIIFDWAGTTVDYGCFAPVQVFIEIFHKRDVQISFEEARKPMGLLKIDHIRAITEMDRVRTAWLDTHGSEPTEADVEAMYKDFEDLLFRSLHLFATPLPHVTDVMEQLRARGIKIGSTTGYTEEMIDIVAGEAKKQGYAPDTIVSSTEVPAGRPYPWMVYENAKQLNVFPPSRMIKVGDTETDMQEGQNAGMWTIGVVKGSSTLGLSQQEVEEMDSALLETKVEAAEKTLLEAGADYVMTDMSELPALVEAIEKQMNEDVEAHV
ncbi:phosphonoacetaldehyde hydrolase [Halobacillus kuroshimensis]|uniref:Phosphonoacetaldehyde hydrolase n=1 Tax=Halobacillus kuroshimensis TaxID=302481 RepID=A0ABS3DWT9_9BACI|nr:phosphonoacetaldehyde hydrolase [Halobacillus kuroshimensis]MBN8235788.1 phosphonoacetaldehyde hydrolase [Halobacillus kuroshimensis]